MKGQVGGISDNMNKKCILSTESNLLLLKPLHNDNRGLRELAFYEIAASIKALERRIDDVTDAYLSRKIGIFDNILFCIYKFCHKRW